MANMANYQLWMGNLEPYMTETFIITAFRKMGESPLNVTVMRNKITGEPTGYCFVYFATEEETIDAMHKLNGKPIPGTSPVVRFKLNYASIAAHRRICKITSHGKRASMIKLRSRYLQKLIST